MKRKRHANAIDAHAASTLVMSPQACATHFQFMRRFFIISISTGSLNPADARGSMDIDGTNIAVEWSPHVSGGAMSRISSSPFATIVDQPGTEMLRRSDPSAEAAGGLS